MIGRKDFIKSAIALSAVGAAGGCEGKPAEGAAGKVAVKRERLAIVYFSRSGNTRYAAEHFAKTAGGARVVEIKALKPYNADYDKCCEEARPECRGKKARAYAPVEGFDLANYDVLLFGTPNWWGTMAPPLRTYVAENAEALKGKTGGIFQTHGGGGMENVGKDFAELARGARVLASKAFYGATIKAGVGLSAYVTDRLAVS